MSDLPDGQYELSGPGMTPVRWGRGLPVFVLAGGYDPGSPEIRDQDVDLPTGDGRTMGRDYLGGLTMQFTLVVKSTTDVMSTYSALNAAWRTGAVRSVPGALATLRWTRAGKTYRVQGRPRKIAPKPGRVWSDRRLLVDAEFVTASPYASIEPGSGTGSSRILTLQLLEPIGDGGLVLPAPVPWRLAASSQARQGVITVGGTVPAPFRAVIKGPVTGQLSNVAISGDGWWLGFDEPVAYDQAVVIDTTTHTITKAGRSIAGSLRRGSRLTSRLVPGTQEIGFVGTDPSATSTLTLVWFDTALI